MIQPKQPPTIDVSRLDTTTNEAIPGPELIAEKNEVQASMYQIARYIKEIEVLTYRMRMFAPHYVANNQTVGDFVNNWTSFRAEHLQAVATLANAPNTFGA